MSKIESVQTAILHAVKDTNLQLLKDKQIRLSENGADLGDLTHLDSLGMAVLLVAVEQAIEDEFGVSLSLVDDVGELPEGDEGFRTLSSLTDHVSGLLAARQMAS